MLAAAGTVRGACATREDTEQSQQTEPVVVPVLLAN